MDPDKTRLRKRSYFYILTLQWAVPGLGSVMFSITGEFAPSSKGATEHEVYEDILARTRKQENIPKDASVVVLYYRIVPNRRLFRKWDH